MRCEELKSWRAQTIEKVWAYRILQYLHYWRNRAHESCVFREKLFVFQQNSRSLKLRMALKMLNHRAHSRKEKIKLFESAVSHRFFVQKQKKFHAWMHFVFERRKIYNRVEVFVRTRD